MEVLTVNPGYRNKNGQIIIEKTSRKSTTHPFARIWIMECSKCGRKYGANSCDAHIRKCPYHDKGKPGEPIL